MVIEPPVDYQLDSLEKLEFYPKVFRNLGFVRSTADVLGLLQRTSREFNQTLVMITHNDAIAEKLKDMGYGTGLWRNGKSPYVAVKVPVYSFLKLHGVDTCLLYTSSTRISVPRLWLMWQKS